MNIPNRLQAIFSPPRRTLASSDPVTLSGLAWGEYVLPRARCLFQSFAFEQVPARRRAQALELKLLSWSPYAHFASYVLWQGDRAQVWVWRLAEGEREAAGPFTRVVPESALRPPPGGAGDIVRLLACTEGYEGQHWRDGVLHGSRWWAAVPDAHAWALFRRSQGLAPDAAVPSPRDVPLAPRPWGRTALAWSATFVRHERAWVMAGLGVVLAIALAQGAGLLRWQFAAAGIEGRLAAIQRQAEPVLRARRDALESENRITGLRALLAAPSQLELLSAVTRQLPPKAVIADWNYDAGTLQVTVQAQEQPDPRYYVKVLQDLPQLSNVSPAGGSGANELKLTAQVAAASASAATPAPARRGGAP